LLKDKQAIDSSIDSFFNEKEAMLKISNQDFTLS